jgi:hypothetical protein
MPTHKNRKKQRNTRKKRGGENGIQETFLQYLQNLKTPTNSCNIGQGCKTPQSKSAQKISVCNNAVFKGPKVGFSPSVNVNTNQNYIQVDPHTMNLLVQTAIKSLENRSIEQYNEICSARDYSYALKGDSYNLPLVLRCTRDGVEECQTNVNSVEDYIKMMNEELDTLKKNNPADLQKNNSPDFNEKKIKMVNQIIGWIKSITESLDFLFKNIQFHHCDPKAAQLFLDREQVIVGDLDKVTFSLNIENEGRKTRYRVCLGGRLESAAVAAKGSIPEKMRYETKPRATNNFEKAAFIASILLLSNDPVRSIIYERMTIVDELKSLREFINWPLLLDKARRYPNFKDRTSHKIASECVYTSSILLDSNFTIGDGSKEFVNPIIKSQEEKS